MQAHGRPLLLFAGLALAACATRQATTPAGAATPVYDADFTGL